MNLDLRLKDLLAGERKRCPCRVCQDFLASTLNDWHQQPLRDHRLDNYLRHVDTCIQHRYHSHQ